MENKNFIVEVDSSKIKELNEKQDEQALNESMLSVKEFEMKIARRAFNYKNISGGEFSAYINNSSKTEFVDISVLFKMISFFEPNDSKTFINKVNKLAENIHVKKDDLIDYVQHHITMNGTVQLDYALLFVGLISNNAVTKVHAEHYCKAKRDVENSIQNSLTDSINKSIIKEILHGKS